MLTIIAGAIALATLSDEESGPSQRIDEWMARRDGLAEESLQRFLKGPTHETFMEMLGEPIGTIRELGRERSKEALAVILEYEQWERAAKWIPAWTALGWGMESLLDLGIPEAVLERSKGAVSAAETYREDRSRTLVRSPLTEDQILEEVWIGPEFVFEFVAANHSVDAELQEWLVSRMSGRERSHKIQLILRFNPKSMSLQHQLLDDPKLRQDSLARIVNDPRISVHELTSRLASLSPLPPWGDRSLTALVHRVRSEAPQDLDAVFLDIARWLVAHDGPSSEAPEWTGAPPGFYRILAEVPDYHGDLASNPDTPGDVLRNLGPGRPLDAARELVGNPALPVDVIEALSEHPDWRVIKALVKNPSMPQRLYRGLAERAKEDAMALSILEGLDVPPDVISKIYQRNRQGYYFHSTYMPQTGDVQDIRERHRSIDVATYRNPNTPKHIREEVRAFLDES